MKKTWLFGMAFALGMSHFPSVTSAQYPSIPYGNGSLAPSAYPIPATPGMGQPIPYGQPSAFISQPQATYPQQAPQQYSQAQYAQSPALRSSTAQFSYANANEYGPASLPAQMVAYPQEVIPVPPVDAPRAPEYWNGNNNNNAQYQGQPSPHAQGQPAPMQSIVGQPNHGYDPAYANALAPTAMNGNFGGACGTGACGAPTITDNGFGERASNWFSNRSVAKNKAWFVGGGALLFRRVDDRNFALTYDSAMPTESPLTTRDARQNRLPGFEVFAGRYFNCGRNALMVNYWGLYPEDASATITQNGGGSYRSRYHFNGIEMPTATVYDWFDDAQSHRVVRSSRYHNVEANLLGFAVGGAARTWSNGSDCGGDCGSCGSGCAAFTGPCNLTPNLCGSRLNWTWLAGFRWFRFTDDLQYAASDIDSMYDGSADDLYYDNNVINDLVGFQLGSAGTYCLGKRFNLYALSKAGIYNNHSELYTRIGRNGTVPTTATIVSGNAYNGQDYMVTATQNNAAFLGELGTGIGARITKGWSANVGYRVIGASGVATAVNTIPHEMIHLGNVAEYNTTSSLILHGVTIGGMYNF